LSEIVLIGLADKAGLCDLIGKIIVGVAEKSKQFIKYHKF